ncbi:V-type ATPase 116kDa subunit family protein [Porphyromonas endodontalis]|uniref:V-type ATP synthase subunit I n=1 Tax=Porphyromonas endodontalis TaxID=28124 RepID=UPI0028E26BCA|nr:V-type ATPase 116kDa subunit family protein [Porphyromonas endodontalis]
MIEKMQKYLFLVYHREYEGFLQSLRELGVVHIKETKSPKQFDNLQALLAKRKDLADLRRRVKSLRSKDALEVSMILPQSEEQGVAVRSEIEELMEKERNLANQIAAQRREIDYWSIWGDYDLDLMKKLENAGYKLHFYVVASQQFKEEWIEEYRAVKVNDFRAQAYFVTIGQSGDARPEADEVKAPTASMDEMQRKLETLQQEAEETHNRIVEFADTRLGELDGYDRFIERDFDFANALLQAEPEANDTLMVLEGWVPERVADKIALALDGVPCYYEQVEIEANDNVPVKLKNNRYARLFEMITKMYSLPNYGELDITALFAPFFMLFFALCFGDGGYGLLLLIGATVAKTKAKEDGVKSVCSMLMWLGGTTAIVGSLMGTVFGMVMPWTGGTILGSVPDTYILNQNTMMYLSVVLGLIQIVFGKFIAGYKTQVQKGFKYGLATYCWAILILFGGLGLVAMMLGEGNPMLAMASKVLLGIAALAFVIALFYNTPGKNIFLNFGSGLWATYNNASGLLGDTLSYIRLFAIGLTGGILGGVFNNLAVQVGGGLPVGLNFVVMAIILLFGHGLNFGLCMISSLVHPLRLTFVEFYKNAEFEGGGRQYTPFK